MDMILWGKAWVRDVAEIRNNTSTGNPGAQFQPSPAQMESCHFSLPAVLLKNNKQVGGKLGIDEFLPSNLKGWVG